MFSIAKVQPSLIIIQHTWCEEHRRRVVSMKASLLALLSLYAVACSTSPPPASLGDSPIHEIRCPSFLDRNACLERAERQCEGGQYTILSEPPRDDDIGEGHTVPVEGTIKHRIITVRCDE